MVRRRSGGALRRGGAVIRRGGAVVRRRTPASGGANSDEVVFWAGTENWGWGPWGSRWSAWRPFIGRGWWLCALFFFSFAGRAGEAWRWCGLAQAGGWPVGQPGEARLSFFYFFFARGAGVNRSGWAGWVGPIRLFSFFFFFLFYFYIWIINLNQKWVK